MKPASRIYFILFLFLIACNKNMSTKNKNVFSVEMVTPTLIDFNELVDEVSWIMLENSSNV